MSDKIILWLEIGSPSAPDRSLVGPKATSLCTLRRLGLPAPSCFFVTTRAFREHLDAHGLASQIASQLSGLDNQPGRIPSALDEIRQLIVSMPLGDALRDQIAAAYNQLDANAVAVRSSATAEDLPGHSFAGQYETFLNVTSLEDCLDAIKKCWASLWTERAYDYRSRNSIDHECLEMAVIIQQQIGADVAGVAFTIDPVTGSPSRIVIESCRGLGDALVSGRVQPDRLVFRKGKLSLIFWDSPEGRRSYTVGDSSSNSQPSLDLKTAKRLARRIRKIEQKLECPQDIEWAARDGRLWFLQARPITVIPEPRSWEDRQVWTNSNLGEVAPDVLTPMTWSMMQAMLVPLIGGIARLVGVDAAKHPLAGLVAGRLYWHANPAAAAVHRVVPLSKVARLNTMFGGDQGRMDELGQLDITDEDLPDIGFSWPKYILSWPRNLCEIYANRTSKGDALMARFKARNDELDRLDIDAASTDELARMVGESLRDNLKDINLLFLLPGGVAIALFQKACQRWLGDEDMTSAYRLMAAQGGIADTQAGLDLWRLAALAHDDPQTERLLLSNDIWANIRPKLGPQYLTAWDQFMAEHGHHCRGELEFINARWAETPDYVLDLVRNYLRSVDQIDPIQKQSQLAQAGAELAEQCRQKLKSRIKRGIFNWSLKRTRKVARDRENWKNEAVRQVAAFRCILLALGRRLQEKGTLAHRDDIFFLEIPEVQPVVSGTVDFDVAERIATRRAEYEKNCSVTPPPVVVGRFDPDKHVAPRVDTDVEVLNGIAVSPGVVTGLARVILRTDDDQHVEAGEILVAPFTDPAWTPYFLPAAGVVMDMGGVLSHGAI
ncbi:MAG: PEP/pyruvate-binding domain-containing protein, partial [Planctomycetota bacterium]